MKFTNLTRQDIDKLSTSLNHHKPGSIYYKNITAALNFHKGDISQYEYDNVISNCLFSAYDKIFSIVLTTNYLLETNLIVKLLRHKNRQVVFILPATINTDPEEVISNLIENNLVIVHPFSNLDADIIIVKHQFKKVNSVKSLISAIEHLLCNVLYKHPHLLLG